MWQYYFSNSFCNITFSHNLIQLVKKLTEVKGSVLDIVLTNVTCKVDNLDVDVFSFHELSDQHLVSFDMMLSFSNQSKISSGVFNYAKAYFVIMSFYILDQQLFDACPNSTKVCSMWYHFKEDLMDVCGRFISKTNKHVSSFPVWYTPEVRHQKKCQHSKTTGETKTNSTQVGQTYLTRKLCSVPDLCLKAGI